jgi:hypothetical protein
MDVNKQWRVLLEYLETNLGEKPDYDGVLFFIGLQELGFIPESLTKNQKVDVMHVAICTLLSTYGYYAYVGNDEDGWPHWDKLKDLPALKPLEQEKLMKEAIVTYFNLAQGQLQS